MEKWKLLLGSRKFWAAFLGMGFLVVRHFDPSFEVPENEAIAFVSVLAAYILGVAVDLLTPGDLPPKFRDQVLAEAMPV